MSKRNSIPSQIPSPLPHEQFFESAPHDADASHLGQQRQHLGNNHADYIQHSNNIKQSLSKQDRVLGIGTGPNEYETARQIPLRGNGILGKNVPPTSYRAEDDSYRPMSSSSDSATARGYSGIEAYRGPKQKRRWSLTIRDKAKGFFGSTDGRGNRRRGDLYSDDDEEEYWEGPKQQDQEYAATTAQAPQQPQRQHNHHSRAQSIGHDQRFRPSGPVYSYEKGRVYPYDTVPQGQQASHY